MLDLDNLEVDDDKIKLEYGDEIEFFGLEAVVTAVTNDKYTLLVEFNNGKKHAFIELKRKSKEKVQFT